MFGVLQKFTALFHSLQLRIPKKFGNMETREGFNFKPIDAKTLYHLYAFEFEKREKYLNGAIVTNFGSVLSLDHTFLSQVVCGVGYGQHVTLMNSHKIITDKECCSGF